MEEGQRGARTQRQRIAIAAGMAAAVLTLSGRHGAAQQSDEGFRFRSGVELVNVTATVSDASGRFVAGLRKEDFVVYEDGERQTITHFSAERVPVSLGVVIDTSGSMAGEKIQAARSALDRFVYDLLDPEDELFLYRFSDQPMLVQGWTTNRQALSHALSRITPNGGTALYDTVAEAIPLAQTGRHKKKALVVISDGNDTSSQTSITEIERLIRESEVLVYAIGIDGEGEPTLRRAPLPRPTPPFPVPFPRPGRGPRWPPQRPPSGIPGTGRSTGSPADQRVNVHALRDLTDDSGGRTEIVREARDLDPATASIADELSRQYSLGYPATGKKDGRWHAIRVEVLKGTYRVRARRGYLAS
jgi:Ca-activated chloride channel family protein